MAKKMTIENLAEMTQKQFRQMEESTQKQFQQMEEKMATKQDIGLVLDAIENLNGRITDVKQSTVSILDQTPSQKSISAAIVGFSAANRSPLVADAIASPPHASRFSRENPSFRHESDF